MSAPMIKFWHQQSKEWCFLQAERGLTGIMNFTNPGAISHNQVLSLYKQYIDPEFSWQNFTVEEQARVIKAPRSNNLLDTTRVSFVDVRERF